MLVECDDKKGAEVYELVIKETIRDLHINRSIQDISAYIDPHCPLGIFAFKIHISKTLTKLTDMAYYNFNKKTNTVNIEVFNELLLPNLLKKLWELEGREKIQHPSRLEIIIDNPENDLENIILNDPAKELKRKIYDAIFRIIPEGFNVMEDISEGNIIAIVCTDELLYDEWVELGHDIVKKLKEKKVFI